MKLVSNLPCKLWTMVHSSGETGEVKFVNDTRFFRTERECTKWFSENFKPEAYCNPVAVQVAGFDQLTLQEDQAL